MRNHVYAVVAAVMSSMAMGGTPTTQEYYPSLIMTSKATTQPTASTSTPEQVQLYKQHETEAAALRMAIANRKRQLGNAIADIDARLREVQQRISTDAANVNRMQNTALVESQMAGSSQGSFHGTATTDGTIVGGDGITDVHGTTSFEGTTTGGAVDTKAMLDAQHRYDDKIDIANARIDDLRAYGRELLRRRADLVRQQKEAGKTVKQEIQAGTTPNTP